MIICILRPVPLLLGSLKSEKTRGVMISLLVSLKSEKTRGVMISKGPEQTAATLLPQPAVTHFPSFLSIYINDRQKGPHDCTTQPLAC